MSGVPEMSNSSSCSLNCNEEVSSGSRRNNGERAYDGDEVLGDDLVEPSEQRLNLLLDRRVQPVVGRQLHELLPILLGDGDRRAALLQLDKLRDAELHAVR